MRTAKIILLSLGCAAFSAQASDFPLIDPVRDIGGAGEGGIGRASASMYKGEGLRLDYLPVNIYFGEHAYINADRVGLKFDVDPKLQLSVFLAHRYEGTPLDGIPEILSGMAIRQQGADLGVGYRARTSWGTAFGEYLQNVDEDSHGSEFRLGVRTERSWGKLVYWPQLTLAWRDEKLNNYYYGVRPDEATPSRPAYTASAGLNVELALYASYPITTHWKALAGVSATFWPGTVGDSPIVQGRVQPAASFGLLYDHSPDPWPMPDSRPLWVKVYYGKATECDLAKILLWQCFSTDTPDDTSVASIEFGRTLIERLNGWDLDVMGYIGFLYHDENGRQPNSWQLNAYFKPYWYGLPWSKHVKTRLGFGTGLSYATRVPFVEAQDQAERGRPTSKLLTYLDPTIDVSFGDLIGYKRWHDVYVGIGVSHRSGIFGFSQLLNNVNGGSNYIYTYLEMAL